MPSHVGAERHELASLQRLVDPEEHPDTLNCYALLFKVSQGESPGPRVQIDKDLVAASSTPLVLGDPGRR